MEDKDLRKLIEKYQKGTATAVEKDYLESWYAQLNERESQPLSEANIQKAGKKVKKAVLQRMNGDAGKPVSFRMLAAAIAALIVLTGSILFFVEKSRGPALATDVAPGGNKAVLILEDGSSVNLDAAGTGRVAAQSGSSVVKLDSGSVRYDATRQPAAGAGTPAITAYNTIKVPLGGQYKLTLPDGTKVWLNAGSSLKFPVSFARLNDRRVFLQGEGYFEVIHDPAHPFYVATDRQEVRVLGTHFDIEAYPDNKAVKTTLLQGSLKVKSVRGGDSCLLVPGKQSILKDRLQVRSVDTETVIDWKDGYFIFNGETLQDILTKVARWYNIQIVYERHVENVRLDGIISKNTVLSEVLSMISATNKIQFEIRGSVLYVK
ncbi:FecR protein [Arachidicoccus rhizosphaerae]|uniref:FecR protein n=1 Tax=Arachidicoccus rhizosphaerae TaxID=551991 RepID=A0A1H4BG22_9BACT|nr:FecR family protein [Arachidicoccus rhizosphaerae]SEA47123.1 FecR protein [Arachidicoccus rhizosphaerae]